MSVEETISFSRTGKSEHREIYAGCAANSKEELRQWAISLWYNLRQHQIEAELKPSAAVWIGNARCQPTQEELDAYELKIRQILEREAERRESGEEFVEPQAVVEEPEQEPESEPELPSLVFDDEDDLDF